MNAGISSNMQGNVYQTLVETSPDLMWHCDAAGRYTYLNPAWEKTLGFTPSEMLGKRICDFQTTEAAAHSSEAFFHLLRGGEMRGCATSLLTHSGSEIDVLVHSRCLRHESGQILGACGTMQVVTRETATAQKLRESEERYREDALRQVNQDLVKAKEAAEQSEEKFRVMVKNSNDAFVLINASGQQIFISDAATRDTGYPLEELKGSFDRVIYPDDLEVVSRAWKEVLANPNALVRVQYRHKHKFKEYIWYEAVAQNCFDNPLINAAVVNVRDISPLKEAEQELIKAKEKAEKNELLFKLIYNSTPVLMHTTDLQGNIIAVNDYWLQTMGYEKQEVIGTKSSRYLTESSLQTYGRNLQELLRTGKITNQEAQAIKKTGETVDLLIGSKVVYDESGKPVQLMTNLLDITERKNAEGAIRLRESYLTAIIENQPGLVWLKDRESRFLAVNRKFAQICGRQHPEELIGKHDLEVFPVDLAMKYREDDQRVMSAGQAFTTEELIADKGEKRWFETFKMPVRNEQGTIIGTTGFAHDITQRKRVEDTLRNTQKLDSLGVLAGGIAHDFNNLLGGIFGYIDLAAHTTTEKPVAEYLAHAMGTIDRVRSLTMQLLTFAKGGAPVKKTDYLAPLIKETVKFALSGSRVLCHFTLPARLWPCEFDRNQIGQVIDNIVINAQQAMPDGGTIDVRGENVVIDEKSAVTLPSGRYVKLSVTDKGIGMPKEILSRIFDPFFTTKAKGHGLGLATCYSIIKRHGGCIEVDSEPGTGSTFHVYLPASLDLILETQDQAASRHHGSGTIVIMDDEKVIRDILSRMLKSLGYSVVGTQHGRETISYLSDAVKAGRPTMAVILDLTIPGGMGGTETCAEIRKIDPNLPVLVVSGYAEDPVIANPEQHGFNGSLSKPFTLQNLAETLTRVRAGRNA